MKRNNLALSFVVALIFINNLSVFGQKNQFYFSIGNNGQISDEIGTFYFFQPSNTQENKSNLSTTQFLFQYDYFVKSNFVLGVKMGITAQRETYTNILNPADNHSKLSQNSYNFSLLGKYVWHKNKLQLSTGLEIPFFVINKLNTTDYYSLGNGQSVASKTTIDGGKAYGLNNISSLKLFVSKKIFFTTDVSFGFLIFNFGGKSEISTTLNNATGSSTENYEFTTIYHKVAFSNPELSFGFGIKL